MRGQILMAAAGLVATGVADTTARVFGEGTVDETNVILIEAELGTFKSPTNWETIVHEGRTVIESTKQMSRFQDLANVNMGVDTNLDTKDGIITYELDIETAGWWGFICDHRKGQGGKDDEHNDFWFRMESADADWTQWHKSYMGPWGVSSWADYNWNTVAVDNDNKSKEIIMKLSKGKNKLYIANRSKLIYIDRCVLVQAGAPPKKNGNVVSKVISNLGAFELSSPPSDANNDGLTPNNPTDDSNDDGLTPNNPTDDSNDDGLTPNNPTADAVRTSSMASALLSVVLLALTT